MSGWRWSPGSDREVEVSPFGRGWWSAPQLARLGWLISLVAVLAGVVQVANGNTFAVVAVGVGAAGMTLAWCVEALVIPLLRGQQR